MSLYVAGARAAGAGSATLPIGSIYSGAGVNPRIREIGVTNTTGTAVAVALCRMSTAGTRGAAITVQSMDGTTTAAGCTAANTHTVAPTLVDMGYRTVLGAAIGSAIIWTFGGDVGMNAAVGTGNGIGIYIPTGTGQILDFYFLWNE
jgi:aconitase B